MNGDDGGDSALPAATIVCCMCGDLGLEEELFQCKACLFRSQHKYCSELYPKADAYLSCNWCLREDSGKSLAGGRQPPEESPAAAFKPPEKEKPKVIRMVCRGRVRRYKLLEEVR